MMWHSFHNQLHLDFKMQLKCNSNVNWVTLKLFPKISLTHPKWEVIPNLASLISHSHPLPAHWVHVWFIMWLVIILEKQATDKTALLVTISMVDQNHNTVKEMDCVTISY